MITHQQILFLASVALCAACGEDAVASKTKNSRTTNGSDSSTISGDPLHSVSSGGSEPYESSVGCVDDCGDSTCVEGRCLESCPACSDTDACATSAMGAKCVEKWDCETHVVQVTQTPDCTMTFACAAGEFELTCTSDVDDSVQCTCHFNGKEERTFDWSGPLCGRPAGELVAAINGACDWAVDLP